MYDESLIDRLGYEDSQPGLQAAYRDAAKTASSALRSRLSGGGASQLAADAATEQGEQKFHVPGRPL